MIKLVATDIDNTILKEDKIFTEGVKKCVKELETKGVKFALVTGRMNASTKKVAQKLGTNGILVSFQGGCVLDGDKVLYQKFLNPDVIPEIVQWARENKIHINVYIDDDLYVEMDDNEIALYSKQQNIDYIHTEDFLSLDLNKVYKIVAIDTKNADRVEKWRKYLKEKYPNFYIVKSTDFYCEILSPEATKGSAVRFLQDYYGLKKEEILTIGDQENDIELLKSGGVKIAMGNATDELKKFADYVTDTVENDGFVKAIEKYVI